MLVPGLLHEFKVTLIKEYCGFIEGYIATTDIDKHGDRLTSEVIEDIEVQIRKNPTRRMVNIGHDPNRQIGEILEWRIDSRNDWKGLWAKVGIYRGREDILSMIENGELTAFSYEGAIADKGLEAPSQDERSPPGKHGISLEVSPDLRAQVVEGLRGQHAQVRSIVRKAEDLPAIIELVSASSSIVVTLYEIWKMLKERRREEKGSPSGTPRTVVFNIVIDDLRMNFEDYSVAQVVQIFEKAKNDEE